MRGRLLLATVLALPIMGIATPSAHAYCAPDPDAGNPCRCDPYGINDAWDKVTGRGDLFLCPM